MLATFLNSRGVEANLEDERKLQRFWFWTKPRAGVHVLVQSEQFPQAHDLLEQPTGSALLRSAIHCPSCGSSRVDYPAMTRKNVLPALVAQVLAALNLMGGEYYCEDCHYTWMPANSPRSESTLEA